MAHYQVLTWRKKRDRSRLVFDDEAIEHLAVDPAEDSAEDHRRVALAACLQRLPEKSRDLLTRCYGTETTIRDVAAGLRRSTEAVYKSLQRVRLALHQCIERRLAEERAT